MNSSYSMLRALLRGMQLDILAFLEDLHTVSIEYTVMREKELPPSLHIEILLLPKENTNQSI
jgi:hypothetical protein